MGQVKCGNPFQCDQRDIHVAFCGGKMNSNNNKKTDQFFVTGFFTWGFLYALTSALCVGEA